jgi:hypothetical protein
MIWIRRAVGFLGGVGLVSLIAITVWGPELVTQRMQSLVWHAVAPPLPPAYIKSVVAYKEGIDGIVIYVIFADATGAMVPASGYITMEVWEDAPLPRLLYRHFEPHLTPAAFHHTTIGVGAFAHQALLYTTGRVPYSAFDRQPTQRMGTVHVRFGAEPQGEATMKGQTTIIW